MENKGLVEYDETWGKEMRHKKPSLVDDEFETPWDDYYDIIKFAKLAPELDVFATHQNSKCTYELTKEEDAFVTDWLLPDQKIPTTVWMNDIHSDHPRCLWRGEQQYQKYNFNIVAIIPANVMRTDYYHDIIRPNRYTLENQAGHIHLEEYWKSIRFLKNGKPTKDSSRNAYMILIWRSKKK